MPEIEYVPSAAGWTVLSHGSSVLALDASIDNDLVAAMWSLIRAGATPGQMLDAIVQQGLSTAPPFVLITGLNDAQSNVLVRGSASVDTSRGGEHLAVTGAGVSSWVERSVEAMDALRLWSDTVPSQSTTVVLESGVVSASAFRWGASSEIDTAPAASAAESIAAPRLEPVREPKPPVAPAPPVGPAPVVPSSVEPTQAEPPAAPAAVAPAPIEPPRAPVEDTLVSHTEPVPDLTPSPSVIDQTGYDHLFGETVVRSVEGAAIRPESDPEPEPASVGDHDGRTVMVEDMAALRAARRSAKLAKQNTAPAEPAYRLELSTGNSEPLDQPLIIGRAPTASRVSGSRLPRLVSMNTPNQDISRTHVQVSVEGGAVVVTDLHSSNGTLVTLPGLHAQKLRPGEPSVVIVGTVIDLGDGATLTVREE